MPDEKSPMEEDADELIPTRWSLIGRLKNWDDQESWRVFFDTYWKLIYGVAMKAGLSHTEAEEVVQETVMAVCRKIGEFKANPQFGSFKSWLMHLARWRIADQFRNRECSGKGLQHRPSRRGRDETESTGTLERLTNPTGNALETMWDAEWERNLVEVALAKLKRRVKARQFQIFYLHVVKELPAQRVVKALGVNRAQVYVVKYRLTPLFKEALAEAEKRLV